MQKIYWTQVWIFDQKAWKRRNNTFKQFKAFIDCSNTMDDVYENINDYNPNRQRKILIVFDDVIADIMTKKNFKL